MAEYVGYINKLNKLSENVPLNVPYGLTFSIGNVCNFRCIYCNWFKDENQLTPSPQFMSFEEFKKIADQIDDFEEPIMQISFVSVGETILNKNLPLMINYLKTRNFAKSVKVVTNASTLTHELSDKLIDAGLDTLKISLQGLSARKYKEICGANIDFEVFREQIEYFYKKRNTCKVHAKIIDIALEPGEETIFKEIFGNISDYIFIEKCHDNVKKNSNKFNFDLSGSKSDNTIAMEICPQPFYAMYVSYKGDVFPCCLKKTPDNTIGNTFQNDLKQIWEQKFFFLQRALLKKAILKGSSCFNCNKYLLIERPENNLDSDLEKIIKRYDFEMGKYV